MASIFTTTRRHPQAGGAKRGKRTSCRAAALADSMLNQPCADLKVVLELCFKALQVQQQASGDV